MSDFLPIIPVCFKCGAVHPKKPRKNGKRGWQVMSGWPPRTVACSLKCVREHNVERMNKERERFRKRMEEASSANGQ